MKLFARVILFNKVTLHADARFLWDFQGMKDGLTGLKRTVAGVERSIRQIKGVDTFDFDFRLNASVSYELCRGLSVQFFVQNLLGANRNKRYSYDFSGYNRGSPHRVRFIEEPRIYGFRMDYWY